MLDGLLNGLIVGWVLTLFDVDEIMIEVVQPFVKTITLTQSHWYFVSGCIGLIGGLFGGC